ncbi:MAG: transcription elongation factor GreA [Parcubacteria group bacterium Gr01-1014_48]|nr:MAG: transcription elongation factor GreA [Parcubacteria group bacterium Greene0416_14]TSC71802.1 MAG: transcription elongation factor GreA [Parcubacteria group bacterium Gr01-1014_48]TSD00986.1 MAG: transcription elongation factor GreA [Parcubacteria group bacterium Greene1014_15]TSD08118.1 MAG: transcription elongation factor GreA [Parcubacteria group bacterium Greene0714_4]
MADNQEKEYLTQEKFNELQKELGLLKSEKRKEVADALEYAKSLGDLSENAEYQEARDMQAKLEHRISHLEQVIKSAIIIQPRHSDVIGIGSTVVVKKTGDSKERTFCLVGSEEANTTEGKISDQSPLGEAMMGKKGGDSFVCCAPNGDMHYKILEVK